MLKFLPGQRWFSETEPELGLGMVLSATPHQVTVLFRAAAVTRQYSIENAPLKRVQFRPGETIRAGDKDEEFKVTGVIEENGLFIYEAGSEKFPEPLLSDKLALNSPRERLLAGHVDEPRVFDLRYRALNFLHEIRKSPQRGFVGGRIALIPHQLYIASEVTNRPQARVLLADEVGLGKTIESCLILHRLLLTGRITRALILVPESLVHQWFVELYRRFNTWFSIFDEERCEAIQEHDPDANPFLDDQLIIASIDLLAAKPERLAQAVAAQWDILIVDEAHHLKWSPQAASPEYQLVETLATKTPHVLLLTATPEQLGEASHFARLRLLDPDRFHDLEAYLEEHKQYESIAELAGRIIENKPLQKAEIETLASALKADPAELEKYITPESPADQKQQIISRLLDQHGTGRVMFRNTRSAMTGFPSRIANLIKIEADDETLSPALEAEFQADLDSHAEKPAYDFRNDPRIRWLAEFLREDPSRKVLLLSRYREKVEAIDAALRERINTKAALFHEKLPLIQRDRNAAWFAEEDGAQILLCSEIGSEGRNFQFAHDLVLFDLPLEPELLEQRIGRLDRIGQTSDIHIHIPVVPGTPQELLARWYHEGIGAFEHHFSGGAEIYDRFHEEVLAAAKSRNARPITKLLKETKSFRDDLASQLQAGRDRLLEMHSFNAPAAAQIVEAIQKVDADARLDSIITDLFDHFGIHIDELGNRTFNLGAGDLFKEKLPGLPGEGLTGTADRSRALAREDIAFLSWDHPIVTSTLDMLLGSEQGNSAVALWPQAPTGGVLVEATYIVEPLAPAALHLDRFLPPTPVRILLNHKRKEFTDEIPAEVVAAGLKKGEPGMMAAQAEELNALVPGIIHVTSIIAGKRSKPIIENALTHLRTTLEAEITRLEQLRAVNPTIRAEEITTLKTELEQAEQHIQAAQVRLDAVRLILASAAVPDAAAAPSSAP